MKKIKFLKFIKLGIKNGKRLNFGFFKKRQRKHVLEY